MKTTPIDDPRGFRPGVGKSLAWLTIVLAISLPLYRPWVTLAAILIASFWLFGGGAGQRIRRLRQNRLTLAVLVFIGIHLLSIAWSSNPGAGFRYVTKYQYLLLIPMLATSVPALFRRRAVAGFEIACALSVVVSLLVFFGAFRFGGAHPGNPSPLMAHLDLSLLLALASLLALTKALYSELELERRLMWAGLSFALMIGLVINIGRSGQLAFAAGLVALLLHWARERSVKHRVLVAAAVAGTLILVCVFSPSFGDRFRIAREEFRSAIDEGLYESNVGGRVAALVVAGEIFREDPLLGTGVGGNLPAFQNLLDTKYEDLKPSIYWYRHFHNQYAQTVTETGLLGLVSLLWIFWELVRGRYRSREVGAAALVLATVYLVGFLGEPFFRKQIPLITFALIAGLISAEKLGNDLADEEAAVDP